jgi:hypothetical protein
MSEITWAVKECYDFRYPSTYIVAAAIIYDGRIYAGMRHNICFAQIQQEGLRYIPNLQTGDGFIDNHGDFHNRPEALVIANRAGQVRSSNGVDLYSEDLW